jgi:hypothetical protein
VDQQRLQSALFPDGVIYANGAIGTAKTFLFFERLAAGQVEKTKVVDQNIVSWNRVNSWLHQIDLLRQAA